MKQEIVKEGPSEKSSTPRLDQSAYVALQNDLPGITPLHRDERSFLRLNQQPTKHDDGVGAAPLDSLPIYPNSSTQSLKEVIAGQNRSIIMLWNKYLQL